MYIDFRAHTKMYKSDNNIALIERTEIFCVVRFCIEKKPFEYIRCIIMYKSN